MNGRRLEEEGGALGRCSWHHEKIARGSILKFSEDMASRL
jgi:hypothetical protein